MTAIQITGLTKRYGPIVAVDDLSFTAKAGKVTGFLGPNGAGKTTTLRMLLGLATPTAGTATFGGTAYRDLVDPIRHVGAVLESNGFHPGRTARDHLRVLVSAAGLAADRVGFVLAQVGLTEAADRRVGGYSLGMRQRLGLAAALLGDPSVLILDEPTNGLDPDGVHWLRSSLRAFAAQGGTVVVSSHLLSEVAQTVDDVVIVAHGVLVRQSSLADLALQEAPTVRVRSPQVDALHAALTAKGIQVERTAPDSLVATDSTSEAIGTVAAAAGVVLHELTTEQFDLEELFLQLTSGAGGPR